MRQTLVPALRQFVGILRRGPLCAAAGVLSVAPLCAQASWIAVPAMPDRGEHELVVDPQGSRPLVFGGRRANLRVDSYVWAYGAAGWQSLGAGGLGLDRPEVVHDAARDVFVGISDSGLCLEWDRAAWSSRPSIPFGFGNGRVVDLAWDPVAQVPVAVSLTVNPHRVEVWELGSSGWSARWNSASGPDWGDFRVTFDPTTGAMWLVSYDYATMAVQTWSFAGGAWQQFVPATTVTPLQWFELVTEPGTGRVMLFGGYESVAGSAVVKDELWFFDGVDWQQHASATAPPPRYFHAMAADPGAGQVFVHGGQFFGSQSAQWRGDLWAWDVATASWSLRSPSVAVPDPVEQHKAYDWHRDALVSYLPGTAPRLVEFDGAAWRATVVSGPAPTEPVTLGFDPDAGLVVAAAANGTWGYAGAGWIQLATAAQSPPPRARAGFVHDGQQLVLAGGSDSSGLRTDTWGWQSGVWTQLAASGPQPPLGQYASLPGGGVLLAAADPIWFWDGSSWQVLTSIPATGRFDYVLGTDRARGRVVFGGGFETGPFGNLIPQNDTWEWDGLTWSLIPGVGAPPLGPTEVGPGGSLYALPLVSAPEAVIAWRSDDPAELVADGQGCAGSTGTPQLRAEPEQKPWIGDAFAVELREVASSSLCWLAVGLADDQWNGQPLPFDLQPFGAPGCLLRMRPDVLLPMTAAGPNRAQWTGALPNNAALVGLAFDLQALAGDPPANAAGFVVSGRLRGLVGQR